LKDYLRYKKKGGTYWSTRWFHEPKKKAWVQKMVKPDLEKNQAKLEEA
jgi:pyruvate dehydrogenase complex dehydrogenase (E1) component